MIIRYRPITDENNYNDPIYEDYNDTPVNLIDEEAGNDYSSSLMVKLFNPISILPTKRTSRISFIAIGIIGLFFFSLSKNEIAELTVGLYLSANSRFINSEISLR